MSEGELDRLKKMPGGSRGGRSSNGNLPGFMSDLKAKTLKSGKEDVVEYTGIGALNGGPTATNVRIGKAAGLLGFNADWRWDDDHHVLWLSYTGLWHGRGEPPDGLERGPFGYDEDYHLHKVVKDAGRLPS